MGLIFNGNGDVIKAVDGSLTVEGLDLDSSSTNINAGIVTGTSANFTGAVSVGGALTYEDVKNVDSVGIITARAGIDLTGGNITLDDSSGVTADRIVLGNGSDFHIYHPGTDSMIDNNTGNLILRCNVNADVGGNIKLQPKAGEEGIVVIHDGSVELYHNNSKKVETTNTGVTVTGTVAATSYTGDGSNLTGITQVGGATTVGFDDNKPIYFGSQDDYKMYWNGTRMYLEPTSSSTTQILEIKSNDQMYINSKDQGLFLMSGNQNVIDIYGGVGGGVYFKHNNSQKLKLEGGNWTYLNGATVTHAGDVFIPDKIVHTGDTNTAIRFPAADTFTVETGGSERVRVDSSGHMGLGITPSDIDSIGRALNIASSTGGAIYLQDTDAPTSKFAAISYNGSTAALQIHAHHSSSYIDFGTNGTERLRITSDGQVNIGTTANYGTIGTAAAFQIYGSNAGGNVSQNIINHASANASSTCDINIWQNYRLANRIIFGRENANNWQSSAAGAASYTAFYTNNAGTVAEKLRITSGGQLVQTTTHTTGSSAHQNTGWYGDDANHYNIEYTDFNEMYALKTLNSNTYDAIVYKRETMTQFCDMEFTFTGSAPGGAWRHFGIAINGDGSDTWSNFDRIVYRVNSSTPGNNHVRLDKAGGGTGFTSQGTHVTNIFDGNEHHFHLQIRKRQFTVSVDGTLVCDIMTDADLNRSSGYPGFVIYEASTDNPWMKVRDFKIRNHTANAKANSMYAGGNKFIQLSRASGNSSETFTRAQMGMDDNEAALIYVTVSGTNLYDYGYHFFHWHMPRGTTSSVTDNIVASYKASNVGTFSVTNSTNDLVVSKDSDLTCHVTIIGGGGRKSHVGW